MKILLRVATLSVLTMMLLPRTAFAGGDCLAWQSTSTTPVMGGGEEGVFDESRQVLVVANLSTLYEWDGVNWSQHPLAVAWSTSGEGDLTYDPVNERVLYLNYNNVLASGFSFATWDGSDWEFLPDFPGTAFYNVKMVYDTIRNVLVVFGGRTDLETVNETWEWDGASWTQIFTAISPGPRRDHAMAFDSARGVTVLFGGYEWSGSAEIFGDTWEYDGSNWILVADASDTGSGPAKRYRHGMVYDVDRGKTVLQSGTATTIENFNDTWEWDGSTWTQRFPTGTPNNLLPELIYNPADRTVQLVDGPGHLTLNYPAPPVILEQPTSTSVPAGGTAFFSVTTEFSGPVPLPPSYQWRKDGVNIPGAVLNVLVVSNVDANDVGVYDCVMQSFGYSAYDCAEIVSEQAALTLSAPATCPSDLDGSGDIGFGDLLILLNDWGACE